jgi:hypothetical protein
MGSLLAAPRSAPTAPATRAAPGAAGEARSGRRRARGAPSPRPRPARRARASRAGRGSCASRLALRPSQGRVGRAPRTQLRLLRGRVDEVVASPLEPSSTDEAPEDAATADGPHRAALKRRWAELIRRVYEVDPLVCHSTQAVRNTRRALGAYITKGRALLGPRRARARGSAGPPLDEGPVAGAARRKFLSPPHGERRGAHTGVGRGSRPKFRGAGTMMSLRR